MNTARPAARTGGGGFRSRLHPDLGWVAATLAVLGAVILPAVCSFPFVMQFPDVEPGQSTGVTILVWFLWHVGAALTVSPMFIVVILFLATPALWLALRTRWAGPASLLGITWCIGLPAAHVTLNGDLTTEAPAMIPVLMVAMGLQCLTGYVILRLLSGRKAAKRPQSPASEQLSPQK